MKGSCVTSTVISNNKRSNNRLIVGLPFGICLWALKPRSGRKKGARDCSSWLWQSARLKASWDAATFDIVINTEVLLSYTSPKVQNNKTGNFVIREKNPFKVGLPAVSVRERLLERIANFLWGTTVLYLRS